MTCCDDPDVRLVSDEGYECMTCGRVLGHRAPDPAASGATADELAYGIGQADGAGVVAQAGYYGLPTAGSLWAGLLRYGAQDRARAYASARHADSGYDVAQAMTRPDLCDCGQCANQDEHAERYQEDYVE